jgi:uncharacterized protein (DUF1330 family)
MILVAILTVQRDLVHDYRAYERRAAAIMADHGAKIERTVVVQSDPKAVTFKEVHIIRFPDPDALAAYSGDARYLELASIREKVVVSTEVLVGEEGPDYGGRAV